MLIIFVLLGRLAVLTSVPDGQFPPSPILLLFYSLAFIFLPSPSNYFIYGFHPGYYYIYHCFQFYCRGLTIINTVIIARILLFLSLSLPPFVCSFVPSFPDKKNDLNGPSNYPFIQQQFMEFLHVPSPVLRTVTIRVNETEVTLMGRERYLNK